MPKSNIEQIKNDLSQMIKGEVLVDKASRIIYSTDASIYQIEPLGVVFPKDKEDVKKTVKYAFDNNISILARGDGSSLAGQALGKGLVLDFTKHMDDILEVNNNDSFVRLQPGVNLGYLNKTLARDNKFFPPDPSSADYCTLGGMLGNNASGGHSVKYGSTIDYVLELELILANGEEVKFKNIKMDSKEYFRELQKPGLAGAIYKKLDQLIKENQSLIEEYTPNARKNCSGYRLDEVLGNDIFNLSKLIVGSEGTLAVITEAKLKIVDLPKEKSIALLYFDDLDKAGRAVSHILELNPSAIEIMNRKFLDLVRSNDPEIDKQLPEEVYTALLVEVDGQSQDEIKSQLNKLDNLICQELNLAFEIDIAYDKKRQKKLWSIRKSAVPILNKLKGPKRITGFVEDVAVDPVKLPDYIRGFNQIMDKYEVNAIIYGHAGHGNTHPRPLLNLKEKEDIQKMESIAEEVYDLVRDLNGTISGEHGDGLLRTQFVKEIYGPLYDLFVEIKEVFDPKSILNPGKVINDDEKLISKNLRYGEEYKTVKLDKKLIYQEENFETEVEKCHGCSKCRSLVGTSMCPIFKAIGDERVAPKSKANILRAIISGNLEKISELTESKSIKMIFDLCLNCKSCYTECPSQVNIPKLMLEARTQYYEKTGQPLVHKVLGESGTMGKLGSIMPSMTNLSLKLPPVRSIMENISGITRQRSFPEFADETFNSWFKKRKENKNTDSNSKKKVAYFTGCSTNYYNPEIGKSMIKVMEQNGIEVIVPEQKCCGIPKINYGDLKSAQKNIDYNINSLADVIKQGYDIVTDCPSCTLALKEEYLDITSNQDAELVAKNTYNINEYLLSLFKDNELNLDFKSQTIKLAYHTPCHLKALDLNGSTEELLDLIPGVEVEEINAGCCGQSGTFGFKKDNYQLSLDIGKNIFEKVETMTYDELLTDCDSCKMQLNEGTNEKAKHPLQILADSY